MLMPLGGAAWLNEMMSASRYLFTLSSKRGPRSPTGPWCKRGLATPSNAMFLSETQLQTASRDPYWQKIPQWRNTSEDDFLSHRWQVLFRLMQGDAPTYHTDGKFPSDAGTTCDFYAFNPSSFDLAYTFRAEQYPTFSQPRSISQRCQRRRASSADVNTPIASHTEPH